MIQCIVDKKNRRNSRTGDVLLIEIHQHFRNAENTKYLIQLVANISKQTGTSEQKKTVFQ